MRLSSERAEATKNLRDAWFESLGESITQPELGEWHQAFGGRASFPRPERGAEALFLSEECEPIRALRGLEVLLFGGTDAPWRQNVDLTVNADVSLGDGYSEAHEGALLRLGGLWRWGGHE